MMLRLIARSRFLWRIYQMLGPENFYNQRKRRDTPPESVGGMHDVFPDGDGWRWNRDHWENVQTGKEGPKLL